MKKLMQRFLMVMVLMASFCGSAFAEQAGKDWYVALRFGYSPYTLEEDGTLLGRNFSTKADLSDIMDKTDTTILGGEVEYGSGKWFGVLTTFYQKSESEDGTLANGSSAMLKETTVTPMVGYQVYKDQGLTIDVLGGMSYVKVSWDLNLRNSTGGNLAKSNDFSFIDPMVGARARYMFTKEFGITAGGTIGGFGVGSELQYTATASLVYAFTDWFAMSAGYKYWYFKYEDSGESLSKLEQKLYGPMIGVQFRF